jgi:hypothetical protein
MQRSSDAFCFLQKQNMMKRHTQAEKRGLKGAGLIMRAEMG